MKTIIHRRSAVSLAVSLMVLAVPAHAGFKVNITHDDVIELAAISRPMPGLSTAMSLTVIFGSARVRHWQKMPASST